jgi:ADP-ribosyl-[dinitrogen reductase] hydrolase
MNKEKIKSSILGFIVGDALGVPFEFYTRQKMKLNPAKTMIGGGSWGQPGGTWSDDTSLVLATLDCLSVRYDLTLLGSNFCQWYYLNEYTPHGEVFDCGIQTKAGIKRINSFIKVNQRVIPMPPETDDKKNGNGSLMRILPFAFYLNGHSIEDRFKVINDVSSLTHSHIRSIISCFIYTELVTELLTTDNRFSAIQKMQTKVLGFLENRIPTTELILFDRILKSDISKLKEREIKSGTYVLETLEAVIWCFLRGGNFRESLLSVVNLGGDTDTVAALVGGLSGIAYGMEGMPTDWMNQIVKKKEIHSFINSFTNVVIH